MYRHGLVVTLALFAVACDPVAGVRKIFSDQGLQLIRPLRSYIEIGGMVMVPKDGNPYYFDRTDAIPSGTEEEPVIKDFSAVLAKESRNNSAGLGAAVGALQALLAVPLGVTYDQSQTVEMGQINASGKRLPIPAAQSFIQESKTKAALEGELRSGGKAFLIYEVYSASTLSIKATGNTELKVDLAIGASTTPSSSPDTGGTTKPAAGAAAPTKPAVGAGAAPQPAAGQESKPAASAASAASAKQSGSDAAPAGISGHWTRKSSTELVLEGAGSYPFAVRVAEVELGPTGLRLKPGSFRFKGNLGAGTPEERYTASVARSRELDLPRKQ